MFPSLAIPDCHTITKAFERGANFCATEESVFAMMTPMLTAMRSQAAAYQKMATAAEAVVPDDTGTVLDDPNTVDQPASITDALDSTQSVQNAANVDAASVDPLATKLPTYSSNKQQTALGTGAGRPTSNIIPQGLTNKNSLKKSAKDIAKSVKKKGKECIPCQFRIDLADDLFKKMFGADGDLAKAGLAFLNYYKQLLQQLYDLIAFWKDPGKYQINLCSLLDFFSKSVCLPDFRRIITALMALLIRLALEINSLFDLILMLVAPLLMPFLLAIINPLEQMLLLIVKPLECIIEAIAQQIEKLDYGAIFNMQIPDIKLGPIGKKKTAPAAVNPASWQRGAEKVGMSAQGEELNIGRLRMNLGLPPSVQDQKREVAEAEANLEKVRQKAGNVDMQDAKAREAYMKELDAARAEYGKKRADLNETTISKTAAQVRKLQTYVRDAFALINKYIEMARTKVTEYINMIFDEIKKLMESVIGSNGSTILKLWDKLQIVQIIAMIVSIIDFLKNKKSCKDEKAKDKENATSGGLSLGSPLQSKLSKIWTDNNGVTHIEEDPGELSSALDKAIGALGQTKGKNLKPTDPNTGLNTAGLGAPSTTGAFTPKAKVIGGSDTGSGDLLGTGSTPLDATRQRLQSLIELTGDPVLDTSIARAVDAITDPESIHFKCPLQTSVAEAEQVNKWIQELNSR